MLKLLESFFKGYFNEANMRRINDDQYEVTTKGWYHTYAGFVLYPTMFHDMFKAGMGNITISRTGEYKHTGFCESECLITIRFNLNKEVFRDYMGCDV